MPLLSKRNGVVVLGLFLLVVFSVGAGRKKKVDSDLGLGVSEDDLELLGDSIEGLEFDDLGGLSGDVVDLGVSEDDLDSLGDALEGLDFEDLEGLSSD